MTSKTELILAIDAALKTLGLSKIFYAVEDDDAYYFTGCADDGERIRANTTCRVNKDTLISDICYHDDACWQTEKTEVKFPKERKDVFIKLKEDDVF